MPAEPAGEVVEMDEPITIADSASTEPTDRSMPPIRITRVMPIAITPITVIWSMTLRMLRMVRKVSVE